MGMVLEHELTAGYGAGSLGGTLGRLNESLERLSRAHSTGSREKPGWATTDRLAEPARIAHLNQTTRLMFDAWQLKRQMPKRFSKLENLLDGLKENTLGNLGVKRGSPGQHSEYQLLAQTLDNLKTVDHDWL